MGYEEAKWQEILFRVHTQTGTYQSTNPEMLRFLKAVGKPSFLSPSKKAAVIKPLSQFQCYLQQLVCFSSLSLLLLSWPGIFLSLHAGQAEIVQSHWLRLQWPYPFLNQKVILQSDNSNGNQIPVSFSLHREAFGFSSAFQLVRAIFEVMNSISMTPLKYFR